jgi:AsnC-type helix-turn-helix domain
MSRAMRTSLASGGVGAVARPRSIDDLDRKVIEELQRNRRAPFRRMARR